MSDLTLSYFETIPTCQRVETLAYLAWVSQVLRNKFHSQGRGRIPSDIFREFSFRIDNEWYADMARKKNGDTSNERQKGNHPVDWSNIRLSEDDFPLIRERAEQWEQNVADLFALFATGYNIFIKRRDNNQTVQVTLIGANTHNLDRDVGISAFAPNIEVAVAAILYKYFDVAEGEPENFLTQSGGGIG